MRYWVGGANMPPHVPQELLALVEERRDVLTDLLAAHSLSHREPTGPSYIARQEPARSRPALSPTGLR